MSLIHLLVALVVSLSSASSSAGVVAPHGRSALSAVLGGALRRPEFLTYDPTGEAVAPSTLSTKLKFMVYLMGGDKVPELSPFGTADWGPEAEAFAKAVSDQLFVPPVKDCIGAAAACSRISEIVNTDHLREALFVKYVIAPYPERVGLLTKVLVDGKPLLSAPEVAPSTWALVASASLGRVIDCLRGSTSTRPVSLATRLTRDCAESLLRVPSSGEKSSSGVSALEGAPPGETPAGSVAYRVVAALGSALSHPDYIKYDPKEESVSPPSLPVKLKFIVQVLVGDAAGARPLNPFGSEWDRHAAVFAAQVTERMFGDSAKECLRVNPSGLISGCPPCVRAQALATQDPLHQALFVKYILAPNPTPDELVTAIGGVKPLPAVDRPLMRILRTRPIPVLLEYLHTGMTLAVMPYKLTPLLSRVPATAAELEEILSAAAALGGRRPISPAYLHDTAAIFFRLPEAGRGSVYEADPEFTILSMGGDPSVLATLFMAAVLQNGEINAFSGNATDAEQTRAASTIYEELVMKHVKGCTPRTGGGSCPKLEQIVTLSPLMIAIFLQQAIQPTILSKDTTKVALLLRNAGLPVHPPVTEAELKGLSGITLRQLVPKLAAPNKPGFNQNIISKVVPPPKDPNAR